MSRKSILCLVSAALVAVTANSATPPVSLGAGVLRPGPPPLERFVKPLGLSAAQQSKLRTVFQQAQMQAAEDVRTAEPGQLDATRKMHEADFHLQLAAVLSPQQLARYDQLTAAMQADDRASESHGAHGHRDSDTPATAIKQD